MAEFEGITPYLHYDNLDAMIEWLTRVFGFVERGRWVNSQGILRNAELYAGTGEVWLEGDPQYWAQRGRRPEEWIGIWVDDVDAMYDQVTAAGVEATAPQDKFYGIRTFDVIDPEGYTWGFIQRGPFVARFEE
jgi:uncharacterized glyoxalase superfamily protein PhnB